MGVFPQRLIFAKVSLPDYRVVVERGPKLDAMPTAAQALNAPQMKRVYRKVGPFLILAAEIRVHRYSLGDLI